MAVPPGGTSNIRHTSQFSARSLPKRWKAMSRQKKAQWICQRIGSSSAQGNKVLIQITRNALTDKPEQKDLLKATMQEIEGMPSPGAISNLSQGLVSSVLTAFKQLQNEKGRQNIMIHFSDNVFRILPAATMTADGQIEESSEKLKLVYALKTKLIRVFNVIEHASNNKIQLNIDDNFCWKVEM